MGVTGSGKTTVGLLLAHQLGVPFADADDFHTPETKAKMASGQPLDDADRAPWLLRLADWLAGHPDGCVLACSALKRKYRDVLRSGSQRLVFLHLAGEPTVASERVAHRRDHYMPASLVGSQYADLEPLQPEELGVQIDFTLGPERIVQRFLEEIQAGDGEQRQAEQAGAAGRREQAEQAARYEQPQTGQHQTGQHQTGQHQSGPPQAQLSHVGQHEQPESGRFQAPDTENPEIRAEQSKAEEVQATQTEDAAKPEGTSAGGST